MKNEQFYDLVAVFRAVANHRRLELLGLLLRRRKVTLQEACQSLRLPFKTASRNLGILLQTNFLDREIVKGQAVYSIRKNLREINAILLGLVRETEIVRNKKLSEESEKFVIRIFSS